MQENTCYLVIICILPAVFTSDFFHYCVIVEIFTYCDLPSAGITDHINFGSLSSKQDFSFHRLIELVSLIAKIKLSLFITNVCFKNN
jgi:hypothetical protein